VSEGQGGERTISLGDISSGRHLKAVVRLHVPTGGSDSAQDVARVALRYEDVRGKKAEAVATESVALGVELVKEEQVALASHAKEIASEVKAAAVAYDLQQAHDLALAGKAADARAALARCKLRNGGSSFSVRFLDGTTEALDLEKVAAVCSQIQERGDLDEAANRLLKACEAGANSMAR
jgi:hypothetical protein